VQLILPANELKRLSSRIEEDYNLALIDHETRIERFRGYYQRWRNRVDEPTAGEEDKPNFSVPLIQWNVASKWADDLGKLLGPDAEITAKPVGPADQRLTQKISRYMTWRVFQAMRLVNPFAVFTFRETLFGRAHAYSPWVRDSYPILDPATGRVVERMAYEGPGFFPQWPDDVIMPAEDAETIHDFSFVIRRYRVRPDDLLRGEGQGLYQGIEKDFDAIFKAAQLGQKREARGEEIKEEKDLSEGVEYQGAQSGRGELQVLEWYGGWRRLRRPKKDAREDNLKERQRFESELVVRVLPEVNYRVVGVQDLMELYPTKRRRRPFVEASLLKDGSYWSPGFGELLESIEDETTVNHRLFTEAGQFSVGPVIFYKPSSGFNPDQFQYAPYQAIPTEDPAGVRVVTTQTNLQYPIVKEQGLLSYAERVTGRTDFSMGRSSDRPSDPKTARGTIALLEQGNIRANLDVIVLREDMSQMLGHFWGLEQQFPGSEKTFFRVTEEQAGGLFPVSKGGAYIEPDELGGRYDFDLKFATSVWGQEAEKERQVQLYGLDLQNPLINQNPRALWMITQRVHKALGDDNFADLMPEPPDLGQPRSPREEWALALQGEEIMVHPDDHDELHIRQHIGQVQEETAAGGRTDASAAKAMLEHIQAHRSQEAQKRLMQALTNQLVTTMAGNAATGQGLQIGGTPMNLQRLQGLISELTRQGNGSQPGAPGAPPAGRDQENAPPLAA
jgi:hypothetical protein